MLTTTYPNGLAVGSVYNGYGYLKSLRDNAAAKSATALEMYQSQNADRVQTTNRNRRKL